MTVRRLRERRRGREAWSDPRVRACSALALPFVCAALSALSLSRVSVSCLRRGYTLRVFREKHRLSTVGCPYVSLREW